MVLAIGDQHSVPRGLARQEAMSLSQVDASKELRLLMLLQSPHIPVGVRNQLRIEGLAQDKMLPGHGLMKVELGWNREAGMQSRALSLGSPSGCWLEPGPVCAKVGSGSLLSPHLSVSGPQFVASGSAFAFSVVGVLPWRFQVGEVVSASRDWPCCRVLRSLFSLDCEPLRAGSRSELPLGSHVQRGACNP